MSAEDNLAKLQIKLPEPKSPVGAYTATKIVGNLLYISGQRGTVFRLRKRTGLCSVHPKVLGIQFGKCCGCV